MSGGPLLPGEEAEVQVAGVTVHRLAESGDERGLLVSAELGEGLPFEAKRIFVVRDVPEGVTRGNHAHRRLHQFLVCVHGECTLLVDDGRHRREILLDSPQVGVHLAPMVWATQLRFSPAAVLLVLASAPYEPEEYVRDYREFLALRR